MEVLNTLLRAKIMFPQGLQDACRCRKEDDSQRCCAEELIGSDHRALRSGPHLP